MKNVKISIDAFFFMLSSFSFVSNITHRMYSSGVNLLTMSLMKSTASSSGFSFSTSTYFARMEAKENASCKLSLLASNLLLSLRHFIRSRIALIFIEIYYQSHRQHDRRHLLGLHGLRWPCDAFHPVGSGQRREATGF